MPPTPSPSIEGGSSNDSFNTADDGPVNLEAGISMEHLTSRINVIVTDVSFDLSSFQTVAQFSVEDHRELDLASLSEVPCSTARLIDLRYDHQASATSHDLMLEKIINHHGIDSSRARRLDEILPDLAITNAEQISAYFDTTSRPAAKEYTLWIPMCLSSDATPSSAQLALMVFEISAQKALCTSYPAIGF